MENQTELKALMKHVQPHINAIDADRDATPEMQHDFSVAAISGTEPSELSLILNLSEHQLRTNT